ncbi:BTB/POZ domain-containing adapter for CUL3-mediated RhoA degradation protein 2-like [Oncorhynchus kisutch]|uniref:Tumor necrosis factor, alpha-induced protein 1 (endothelial) n=1 Tax=Oncorhynchus kisutch TaxID=8019 RepID=A0A8C7JZA7_ONCKI|nr:BTB/POZ domain-containing adapter for CUL3-mediated RhoA degradation protein 2-like [Oncorhynchus kisutch]
MICLASERLCPPPPPVAVTTAGDIRTSICRVVIYLQRDMSGDSCQLPLHWLCLQTQVISTGSQAIRPSHEGIHGTVGNQGSYASQMACPKTKTCSYRAAVCLGNKYVRLNVGGTLFYTTLQVLTRQDSMLKANAPPPQCSSNTHRMGMEPLTQDQKEQSLCVIPVVTSAKEEERLIQACTMPVVKLLYKRSNNKYSYTSNSDDNLLKNIELFDKLSLSYNGRVLFIKAMIGDEICCWSFYGQGRKLAEVCCTSIVYVTEKKQVEFPEARIYEETLNALLYETLPVPDDSLLEATRRRHAHSHTHCGFHSEEEEGPTHSGV